MEDNNPSAHAVSPGHITNPLIIIHVTCMVTAYGILMPIGIMASFHFTLFHVIMYLARKIELFSSPPDIYLKKIQVLTNALISKKQLGIRRHKIHVPLMTAAVLVALTGYFFGYFHHMFGIGEGAHDHDEDGDHQETGGDMTGMPGMHKRQAGDTSAEHYGWGWKTSAHGAMANFMLLLLFVQVGMGLYRKLTKGRPRLQLSWLKGSVPKKIHSYLGKAHLVLAYIQMVLGAIRLIEACPGQAFGQCISHIVMVRGSNYLLFFLQDCPVDPLIWAVFILVFIALHQPTASNHFYFFETVDT